MVGSANESDSGGGEGLVRVAEASSINRICETPTQKRNPQRRELSFPTRLWRACGRKRLNPPAHRRLVSDEVGNTREARRAKSGLKVGGRNRPG